MVAGVFCRLKFDVFGVNTSVVGDLGGGGVLSAEVVDLGWWCCIFLGGLLGCYMHVRLILKM
jgi:hypothetical protein